MKGDTGMGMDTLTLIDATEAFVDRERERGIDDEDTRLLVQAIVNIAFRVRPRPVAK